MNNNTTRKAVLAILAGLLLSGAASAATFPATSTTQGVTLPGNTGVI